jgi:hypothetical protein
MPKIKAAFDDFEVAVGILASAGKHADSNESIAQLAAWNEYGTPKIPERPAFRASFHTNRKKYLKMLRGISQKGFTGKKITANSFDHIGRTAQKDVQKSISGGSWAANAESTQFKKGGGKQRINNPLINTGQTIDSVSYRVKKK